VIHRFGPFEADGERYELRKFGRVVPIQRRTLDLILFLAASDGRLVTSADLIAGPWHGTAVSNAALSQAIMQARRALTWAGARHGIATVRGKGFRFDADAFRLPDRHPAQASSLVAATGLASPDVGPRRTLTPDGGEARAGARTLRLTESLLRLSTERADPERRLDVSLTHLHALLEAGEGAAFGREADNHRRLAERIDHPAHRWYADIIAATRLFRRAEVRRAAALVTARWRPGLKLVGPMAREIAAAHLLNLALEETGRRRRRTLGTLRVLLRTLHGRQTGVMAWRTMLALTELQLGDPEAARRVLGEPGRVMAGLGDDYRRVPTLISLVDLLIAFRDAKHLFEIRHALRPALGRNVCLHFADWGPVAFHLGRVTRELGERNASRDYFEQALAHSKNARSTCWESWAAHGLARALVDSGRPGAAARAAALLRGLAQRIATTRLPALSRVVTSFWPSAPASYLKVANTRAARR
jgi:DNA-binding winged helix-turn-helix (wHTH) protein